MSGETLIVLCVFVATMAGFFWWITRRPTGQSLPGQVHQPQPPVPQGFNFNGVSPITHGLAQLVANLKVGEAIQARDHLGQGIMISVVAHEFGAKVVSQRDQFGQEQRYRVTGNNVVEHIH